MMRIFSMPAIRQKFNAWSQYLSQRLLSGGLWTFGCILAMGVVMALFLYLTVYSRPLEEVAHSARRIHHIMTIWLEHGFFQHAGLGFSESPDVNPRALVYRSRPPAFIYPLYILNFINYKLHGVPFSLELYVLYNQAILWFSASCLGFLGFRIARRLGTSPLLALAYAVTGQYLFQTVPNNLEMFFEVLPEHACNLFLIVLLLLEEIRSERELRHIHLFRGGLGSGYPVNDRLRLYIIMNHLVTR